MKILYLVILLLLAECVYAQTNNDSINIDKNIYCNALSNYPYDSINMKCVDTSLNNFNLNDLILNYNYFYNSIGNIGLSHKTFFFKPNNHAGFIYGYDCFEKYILTDTNTYYYINQSPYTNLTYLNAPGHDRIEEAVYVQHNQNLGKTISVGTDFFFINSKGFYVREHARVANFSLNLKFNTLNQRYGFLLAYYHSRVNNEENGGMIDDTQFVTKKSNRKIVDMALSKASNLVKNGGLFFNQYFYMFKRDSAHINNTIKIYHKLNFIRDRRVYQDDSPNTNYYFNIYGDSTKIYDSTGIYSLYNTIALTNFENQNDKFFQFEFGSEVNLYDVNYYFMEVGLENKKRYNQFVTNIIPYSKLRLNFKYFVLCPEAKLVFGNRNLGDYEIKTTARINIKNFYFKAMYISSGVDAPLLYDNLYTSVFQWDNSFKKTFSNQLNLSAKYKNLQIDLLYNIVNNYIYLDKEVTPQMNNGAIHYFSAGFIGSIDFWRFTFGGRFVYQWVNDKEVVRVPDFMCKVKLAYHQFFFKKKLLSEIGIDCMYNTAFYAEAYMPAIRSFYLQNDVRTGNFPYLNIYIKMQVKRARFFIELINFVEGITEYNYISVPHYPLNDRQIKFGLSWYFHD